MCDILSLSLLLPNVNKMLDQIVQQVIATGDPLADSRRTPYNASLVLGMCLKSFSGQAKSSKSSLPSFDLVEICQRWGWSENVVGALASLATSRCVVMVTWFLISWLTLFEFWISQPSATGGDLHNPEGIVAVTLTFVTVKCFAYPLLLPRDEIP